MKCFTNSKIQSSMASAAFDVSMLRCFNIGMTVLDLQVCFTNSKIQSSMASAAFDVSMLRCFNIGMTVLDLQVCFTNSKIQSSMASAAFDVSMLRCFNIGMTVLDLQVCFTNSKIQSSMASAAFDVSMLRCFNIGMTVLDLQVCFTNSKIQSSMASAAFDVSMLRCVNIGMTVLDLQVCFTNSKIQSSMASAAFDVSMLRCFNIGMTVLDLQVCFTNNSYDSVSDYTLWPFWVDTHVDPPFRKEKSGQVYDVHGHEVQYFSDVPDVLKDLHSQGYTLGIASRTSCTQEANDLTRLFDWDQFFQYREIYPGSKTTHFKKIHKDSGIALEDMIFFDDEHRNIVQVGKLGVLCIFVSDGVTRKVVADALKEFAQRKGHNPSSNAKVKRVF
ncbi:hypothetical protein ACOMHN_002679 [Nucella lapillus]